MVNSAQVAIEGFRNLLPNSIALEVIQGNFTEEEKIMGDAIANYIEL